MVDDALDRFAGRYGGKVGAHDVAGGEAVQGAFEARALAFGASSAVEEPADEDEPDAIKNVSGEEQKAAREHEHVTEHLPDAGRNARRLGQAFGTAPNNGPEHTAAIQRKARQDVEDRQQQV